MKGGKTPQLGLICCSNEVKCHVLYVPERKGGEGKAVTALHIQLAQVIGFVPFSSDSATLPRLPPQPPSVYKKHLGAKTTDGVSHSSSFEMMMQYPLRLNEDVPNY